MNKVLFVCTGNICRSSTAEAILRMRKKDWQIDSCGTHNYHVGEKSDMRAIHTAQKHEINMQNIRARQIASNDFDEFDFIVAMDQGHLRIINQIKPALCKAKISLFLDHSDQNIMDVPDPYYGEMEDFDTTFSILEKGMAGLIRHIEESSKV